MQHVKLVLLCVISLVPTDAVESKMRARAWQGSRKSFGEDGHKASKTSERSINETNLLQQQVHAEELTAHDSALLHDQLAQESKAKAQEASDNVTQVPQRSSVFASAWHWYDKIEAPIKWLFDKLRWAFSPSSYSKYECHGSEIANSTCGLENVCYDLNTDDGQLHYFAQASDNITDSFLKEIGVLPGSWLGAGPDGRYWKMPLVHIQVSQQPIPERHAFLQHEVTVLLEPCIMCGLNFGHELADTMFTYFVMQHTYGVVDPFSSQWLTQGKHAANLDLKLWPAVSRNRVLQLKSADLRAQLQSNHTRWVCFRKLLLGSGPNNYIRKYFQFNEAYRKTHGNLLSTSSNSYFYWIYRCFIIENLMGAHDADVACGGNASNVRNRITILEKSTFLKTETWVGTGPGFQNGQALQTHLALRFPKHVIEYVDFAALTLRVQVQKAMTSVAMFSHAGGGSFIAMFLPFNATLAMVFSKPFGGVEFDFMSSLWLNIRNLTDVNRRDIRNLIENRNRERDQAREEALNTTTVNTSLAEEIVRDALLYTPSQRL